jgi:hypothetical protein
MDINKLEFQIKELNYNLNKCKDPITKIVIKDILDKKIKIHKNIKSKNLLEKEIESKLDKIIETENQDEAYKKILKENEEENYKKTEKKQNDKYWNKTIDSKYKEQVEGDMANNKLMERLNSELDFRVHGHDKKTIIKPFFQHDSDDEDDYKKITSKYVKINKFTNHTIPSTDFTSQRMLGKRKNL